MKFYSCALQTLILWLCNIALLTVLLWLCSCAYANGDYLLISELYLYCSADVEYLLLSEH